MVIANDKLQMSILHCELLIGILYFVYFRNRSSNHKICTFFKVWIQRLGGKCVDVKDIAGGLLSAWSILSSAVAILLKVTDTDLTVSLQCDCTKVGVKD